MAMTFYANTVPSARDTIIAGAHLWNHQGALFRMHTDAQLWFAVAHVFAIPTIHSKIGAARKFLTKFGLKYPTMCIYNYPPPVKRLHVYRFR